MRARRPKSEKIMRSGEAMLKADHPEAKAISERIAALKEKWKGLEHHAAERRRQLEDAAEACSVREEGRLAGWLRLDDVAVFGCSRYFVKKKNLPERQSCVEY